MNPITNAKNLNKLNEKELSLGLTGSKTSWHSLYEGSAWIFVGGLAYDLTEGDVISVFSQYGEIVNLNLVRDKKTGKPKGYCFICYEDQRSTNLAVDNFNGIKLLNRILRVDHVKDYRMPKEFEDEDEMVRLIRLEGCGPGVSLPKQEKRGSSPDAEKEEDNKRSKKLKVKAEPFSDSDNEGRKRISKASWSQNREVKREKFSSSDDERGGRERSQGQNENRRSRHDSPVAAVRVKEEPVNSAYDKYDRTVEHRSNGRREEHEPKRSKDRLKRSKDRQMSHMNTKDTGNDEFSRHNASGSKRNREDRSRDKDEDDERFWNRRDDERFDKRQQEEEIHRKKEAEKDNGNSRRERKSWSREGESQNKNSNTKHRNYDKRSTDRREDTSADTYEGRNDTSAENSKKRLYRDSSHGRHRHRGSSSSDEDKRRRR